MVRQAPSHSESGRPRRSATRSSSRHIVEWVAKELLPNRHIQEFGRLAKFERPYILFERPEEASYAEVALLAYQFRRY